MLELNIRISNRKSGIISAIEGVLEDAENGLSAECRAAIHTAKEQLRALIKSAHRYDDCLEKSVSTHPDCKKLLKLLVRRMLLNLALGCAEIGTFNRGRDASACIGVTPIQYSSGEKSN